MSVLSAELLAKLERKHVRVERDGIGRWTPVCQEDQENWPCAMRQVLDRLFRVEAEVETLKKENVDLEEHKRLCSVYHAHCASVRAQAEMAAPRRRPHGK